mgnify:CR=1 FL=1
MYIYIYIYPRMPDFHEGGKLKRWIYVSGSPRPMKAERPRSGIREGGECKQWIYVRGSRKSMKAENAEEWNRSMGALTP